MIKNVLFDLDGTLLPMDTHEFEKAYFTLMAKKVAPLGYEPQMLVKSIWKATMAMIVNDGSCSNYDAFWKSFSAIYGEKVFADIPVFDDFYLNEFLLAKSSCGYNPEAKKLVDHVKSRGYRVILATNPIFPEQATLNRVEWSGCKKEDFEFITTYENSSYCKPNIRYYEEILKKMDLKAEECIMIGNDVDEDMVAKELGMEVFLLTDCLLNKNNKDISAYPCGSFLDCETYLDKLNNR